MEGAVLLGLLILLVLVATPLVAFVAFTRTKALDEEMRRLRLEVQRLSQALRGLEAPREAADPRQADPTPTPAPGGERPVAVEAGDGPRVTPGTSEETTRPTSGRVSSVSPPGLRVSSDDTAPEPTREVTSGQAEFESPSAGEEPSAPPGAEPGAPSSSQSGPPPEKAPEREPTAARTAIDFETLIGSTWLLRIGLGVLAIAFALFARSIVPQLPAAAKVALAYTTAMGLFATGRVFENRLERFARPVMAAGLTFGFFVAYGAHFVPAMSAVSLPVSLTWMVVSMVTVLIAAERWESQVTAALALLLGHVSAFVSAGDAGIYPLVMIAFLAATAAALVLRHTWLRAGLFAVALSYGSHLAWILGGRDPISGDSGFWVNLAFLTSYYTVFLIADVLWWRRDADGDRDDADPSELKHARELGPANLVLYVALASFVYAATGARLETIEWFYVTLGITQGALAWFYWGVRHRDFAFYPAFGTVLWTMGMFAALDALALNLVLAVQALLLLLAAHQTRLWIFHALAQLALLVAFVHYLVYPAPEAPGIALLLGGIGIAAVYLLKASLEEVWYGDGDAELWERGVEGPLRPSTLKRAFGEVFESVAPLLAPLHAALGSFVLVREVLRHFGTGLEASVAVVGAQLLVGAIVLFRQRGALLFAFTGLAVCAPYLTAEAVDATAALLLVDGLVVAALLTSVLSERRGPVSDEVSYHAQAVVTLALVAAFVALGPLDLDFATYLPAMTLPLLVLLFQERCGRGVREEKGKERAVEGGEGPSPRAVLATIVCIGAALGVVVLTSEAVGIVVTAPVWIVAWAALLFGASRWRRSTRLFVAGYTLLFVGYALFVAGDRAWIAELLGTLWVGAVVVSAPLLLALGMDRGLERRIDSEQDTPRVADAMTYAAYALALLLAIGYVGQHVARGWSLVVLAGVGLALMSSAKGARTPRAPVAAVVMLLLLHLIVTRDTYGSSLGLSASGIEELLLPLLAFAAITLVSERAVSTLEVGAIDRDRWRSAQGALVAIATLTMMLAIYRSTQLGTQWATAGWSVVGVALMAAGFGLKSAPHRRVALAALGACLLRVFIVDLQVLSDTARTIAFFVLGICLVGAAWLYSRFSEELKSWL